MISKGTIYINGELNNDRASFRFVLEKETDITEYDVNAILECYK
jgi:hypothetical protein